VDRLDAMRLFVRLVELRSFSAAARELRVKQSTASKWVAALEDELGTSLMDRTTRTKRVTEAGELLYRRAREILSAYDDTAAELHGGRPAPAGRIRASLPVVFGRLYVVPEAAAFMRRFPDIDLELVLADRYVNLVEEGFDVAIRVGVPVDSSLRARTLAVTPRRLVASRAYIEAHGRPRRPDDLRRHDCLLHSEGNAAVLWSFRRRDGEAPVRVPVRGRFVANNADAVLHMARSGLGVALLASWLVDPHLRARRLVSLLRDHQPPPAPIQALMPPARHVHPRVKAFVDFLAAAFAARFAAPADPGRAPTRAR
jgi:DNA-binding transcriptional LysR family regulator